MPKTRHVVGTVGNGDLLIEEARRLHPDVIVVTRGVMERMAGGPGALVPPLTPRQRDVLRLMKGWTVVDMKNEWKVIYPFEKK